MATGTVAWFSVVRGFGFIAPDLRGKDVLVRSKDVAGGGERPLTAGTRVEFETGRVGAEATGVVRCPSA